MILVGRGWTYSGRFIPAGPLYDGRTPLPHRDEVRQPINDDEAVAPK